MIDFTNKRLIKLHETSIDKGRATSCRCTSTVSPR